MILFTILAITVAVLAVFLLLTVGTFGGTILVVFGDAIVFVILIIFLVKCLRNKTWRK